MLNRIAGWFRPKVAGDDLLKRAAAILESGSPDMIIETTRGLICDLDPNGCVMAMVGYKNMKHIYLPVSQRTRQEQIHSNITVQLVPNTIEQYAKFISDPPIPNEETRRRCMWLMFGLFLMKAEELAERDVSHEPSVQDIWNHLSQYRSVIDNALKENILWTDDEKDVGLRNVHRRHRA